MLTSRVMNGYRERVQLLYKKKEKEKKEKEKEKEKEKKSKEANKCSDQVATLFPVFACWTRLEGGHF